MDLLHEQYIFHSCPQEMELSTGKPGVYSYLDLSRKEKSFWADFLKILFSTSTVQYFGVIWRNPHPVARIH